MMQQAVAGKQGVNMVFQLGGNTVFLAPSIWWDQLLIPDQTQTQSH